MKPALVAGSLAGFLGVAAGAFGAHGLKDRLAPEMLALWETAARYQLVHALALVAVALVGARVRPAGKRLTWLAAWLFTLGIVIFSGSLYALALTGVKALGAITPFGGVAFLTGWLALGFSARHLD